MQWGEDPAEVDINSGLMEALSKCLRNGSDQNTDTCLERKPIEWKTQAEILELSRPAKVIRGGLAMGRPAVSASYILRCMQPEYTNEPKNMYVIF